MADPGMIAGIIQGGVGSLLDTIGLGYGIYQDQRNNQQSQKQWQAQYDFARESRDLQQSNLELMMAREDSAIQRRVADLEAAGIHKNLAVGGGAAGSGPYGNVSGNVNQGSVGSQSVPMVSSRMDLQRTLDNHEVSMAEVARLRAEAEAIKSDTSRRNERHPEELQNLKWDATAAPERYARLILENDLNAQSYEYNVVKNAQDIRLGQLREYGQQLSNIAAQLGITQNELENRILQHDADVILGSSALRGTEQFETDTYVNSIIPGDTFQSSALRSALKGILNTGNAMIGSMIKRGRK